MTENHLDTPFTYTGLEANLAAALDARDAIIARQRETIVGLRAERALPASAGCWIGLALSLAFFWLPLLAASALVYLEMSR